VAAVERQLLLGTYCQRHWKFHLQKTRVRCNLCQVHLLRSYCWQSSQQWTTSMTLIHCYS